MTRSSYSMLAVEDALEVTLAQARQLAPVHRPLSMVRGAILAADIAAQEPLPPFPASTKDGYAVVAADGPGDYPLVGEVSAGALADFAVEPGTVAYITTGAPMPAGADAVVMVEETERLETGANAPRIRIKEQVQCGADVRPVGVDVEAGQIVLAAGERMDAAEIGLLATAGIVNVPVFPAPKWRFSPPVMNWSSRENPSALARSATATGPCLWRPSTQPAERQLIWAFPATPRRRLKHVFRMAWRRPISYLRPVAFRWENWTLSSPCLNMQAQCISAVCA